MPKQWTTGREGAAVPARIAWTMQQLATEDDDRLRWTTPSPPPILEIGCGAGLALPALLAHWPEAAITAIDCSLTQVQRTRERLEGLPGAERVQIASLTLEAAPRVLGSGAFGLALAINVNLFWTNADGALRAVTALLAPAGRLVLVYEPPSVAQRSRIRADLERALHAHQYRAVRVDEATIDGRPLLYVASVRP